MPLTNRQKGKVLKKKVRETLRNLKRGQRATSKEVIGSLKRAREEIATILRGAERFEMPYFRAMMDDIDGKIVTFTDRMNGAVRDTQTFAFNQGENLIDDILKGAGVIYAGGPKLSDELIVSAHELSTDAITGISDEMRKDISRNLRRSLLTGENNYQAARKIDKIIGISKKKGYLNRADVISRTEINRAYSTARQAKDEQVVERLPELEKQWLSGPRPRHKDMGGGRGFISHADVNGQIRKVNEPFDVGGEKLMAPRLGKKPENNVNCDCQSAPFMRDWE